MSKKYLKSPMNYMGGKYKTLDRILPVLCTKDIDTFYDVFSGGFNVGINVKANSVVCNDHINYLIDLYKLFQTDGYDVIRAGVEGRIKEFSLSKENADGYNALRSRYNKSSDLVDLFVLTCFSFNHQIRFNNSHKFNTPFGKNRSTFNASIDANLKAFCEALQEKTIIFSCLDFRDFDFSKASSRDLIYCDPPYLISTGAYNDGKRGFSDWGDNEEMELLNILSKLDKAGIRFALSNVFKNKGLENKLLIEWSDSFNVHFIDNSFNNCSYQYRDRKSGTLEVLVTNY